MTREPHCTLPYVAVTHSARPASLVETVMRGLVLRMKMRARRQVGTRGSLTVQGEACRCVLLYAGLSYCLPDV